MPDRSNNAHVRRAFSGESDHWNVDLDQPHSRISPLVGLRLRSQFAYARMLFRSLFALAVTALTASSAHAEECSATQLASIATNSNVAACTSSSGVSIATLTSAPSTAQVANVCKTSACVQLLQQLQASSPQDCSIPTTGLMLKSQLIDPLISACSSEISRSGSSSFTSSISASTSGSGSISAGSSSSSVSVSSSASSNESLDGSSSSESDAGTGSEDTTVSGDRDSNPDAGDSASSTSSNSGGSSSSSGSATIIKSDGAAWVHPTAAVAAAVVSVAFWLA